MIINNILEGINKVFRGETGQEETVARQVEGNRVNNGEDAESKTQDSLKTNARAKRFLDNSVQMLQYPQTINTEEQPHSVNFTIKVREQGKMGQAIQNRGPVQFEESEQNKVSEENLTPLVQIGTAFGGAALAGLLTKNGAAIAKVIGTTTGAIGGYAIGENLTSGIIQPNRTITTSDIITLYVPQSPQSTYEADYQDSELGLAGAIGQNADNGLGDLLNGDLGEFATRQLVSAADIGKAIGINVNIRGAIQAATRKITNPFKEQLFKTMNFREFGFEFKFAPKNDSELNATMNIINTFKYHMHPEKTQDGLFLIYPSEFDIEFRYKGKANTFVNRISSCALTNMKVDYGSGGVLTTIRNTAGAPSEITMGLQFKELEILTKERIEAGY